MKQAFCQPVSRKPTLLTCCTATMNPDISKSATWSSLFTKFCRNVQKPPRTHLSQPQETHCSPSSVERYRKPPRTHLSQPQETHCSPSSVERYRNLEGHTWVSHINSFFTKFCRKVQIPPRTCLNQAQETHCSPSSVDRYRKPPRTRLSQPQETGCSPRPLERYRHLWVYLSHPHETLFASSAERLRHLQGCSSSFVLWGHTWVSHMKLAVHQVLQKGTHMSKDKFQGHTWVSHMKLTVHQTL